ncbi:DUF324 domain-containing protein [hydrothermal vent metagenome]|uniref:DUF324 domain-containing protein n=1 Tax=hydrothermal vent metagenome TaxID=652676 RepID=A0A1W1EEF9_9ZZZZ
MIKRHIAHITIEAVTPLKVGSSSGDFFHDSPVQRDWNDLPMILGTSIAGVLRKDFIGNDEEIFGKENGSKVIFSNALLVDEEEKVNESLCLEKSSFLNIFDNLPIREHTAITDKGVAKKHSKFDEEVVYKGTRFRFSLEMLEDENAFNSLLKQLESPTFRLGGGSTKGFGKFKVEGVSKVVLSSPDELAMYDSSLNSLHQKKHTPTQQKSKTHTHYMLSIKPDNFFMFGSGFGDEDADQTPVYEKVVDYTKKDLSENYILMPASSIKGAIAHRATYHYNVAKKLFVGNNDARTNLSEIFGEAKQSDKKQGSKGKALFSDVFKLSQKETKIFDHVSIDRFTGGGIDGALFQEKTVADMNYYNIEILLENDEERDMDFVYAFEKSLDDICTGMLSLGGATTKGHGVFEGKLVKDGEPYNVSR